MPSTDAASSDPSRERLRQRLQAALSKREPAPEAAAPAGGGSKKGKGGTAAGGGSGGSSSSDRPPTEEEQEKFAQEMLQQNDEMRRAFVASYYLVHFAVGAFALWLFAAHMQSPFAEDAAHLVPLRRDVGGGEVAVSLLIGALACAFAAGAAYTRAQALLRVGLALCVFPVGRFALAFWHEPRLWGSAWHLLWIPVAPPAVLGIQLVIQKMLDDMDKQVLDFYARMRAGLKGA